jgi:hypothetical protein
MKAVLRVYWILFTAFRIQRWLGIAGLIVLAIGLLVGVIGLLDHSDATLLALGLIGFTVLVVIPTAFAAGATVRALSVPNASALLPNFRIRVLLAIALFVASIGLPSYGVAIAVELAGGPAGTEVAAVYVVGGLTAVVLSVFVITSNPNWMWLGLPMMFAFTQWLEVDGPRRLAAAGYSLPWIVGAASAAAWLVFVIWYLRVARIRPVLLLAPERGLSELYWRQAIRPAKHWPAELTRERALGTLLMGRLQRPLPQQLLISAGVGVLLCLVAPLLQYLPSRQHTTPPFTAFVWPFYAMLFTSFAAGLIVRQSRRAWLTVGGPRVHVFRAVEREMARFYLRAVTCITALVLASLWVFETPPAEAAWGIALMVSAALYSACMGLASVRTAWPIAFGLLGMTIVQVIVLGVERDQAATSRVAALLGIELVAQQVGAMLAIQLVAAGAFRAVAELRWRSIDWLKFRPLRIGRNAIHSGTRA